MARYRRKYAKIKILATLLLTAGTVVLAYATVNHHNSTPEGKGNLERGTLTAELYRGAAVPDELLVVDLPGNCENHLDLTLKWNKAANLVTVKLKGQNVLEPYPDVTRTEDVNYFPNPFWPEPKDIVDGRYQLWLISPHGNVTFYYDVNTAELLGSEYDFASPPEQSIPVDFPTVRALPTGFIQPDSNGNVDFTFHMEYDNMVRGDLPQYTHVVASFIPHNLCLANPYRYDLTTTRPYAVTLPASEALTWEDYLRDGLIFDTTIEPAQYYTDPPLTTMIATYSNTVAVGGGIPQGWTFDLEAVFMGVAPPIKPWEGAGSCEPWFKPKRDRGINFCQMQQP